MSEQEQKHPYDALVLGAGIVGISTALHLQARGQTVCLVDRGEPGQGTSYGNAGLIERSAVVPYAFPRDIVRTIRYALNQQPDVHFHLGALLKMSGWLWRFWCNSGEKPLHRATEDMLPLIERSITEHAPLIEAAGLEQHVRKGGWIDVFRQQKDMHEATHGSKALEKFHLDFDILDGKALRELEPGLKDTLIGGIHWKDPWTLHDPGTVVAGYADLFRQRGGTFVHADARTLERDDHGWMVTDAKGEKLTGKQAVIALGPDTGALLHKFHCKLPLAVKRGYHMHYAPQPNVPELTRPICDAPGGYVLSSMPKGIRLTTGIEFADADAPIDMTQLKRELAIAKTIYPLGEAVEAEPWLGRRPCLPDMRPVIGPMPSQEGLWLNFGHNHHGITLGPVSGRLLAEMMTGEDTCVNPAPYSATRFA